MLLLLWLQEEVLDSLLWLGEEHDVFRIKLRQHGFIPIQLPDG